MNRDGGVVTVATASGYKPRRMGCPAHGGRVPNSRKYWGAAYGFDRRCWGVTVSFMHHERAIIAKHGFPSGLSLSDCGRMDGGLALHSHARRSRFAGRE
jgi:hypothetical protein